ncbi:MULTISPECIES: hypothetical protein [Bacillus subtilis group]|uniref:hypothetical protein n=1 Tax=Bacillus TaxID=1386 RepID=UPI0009B73E77|nr:MULTISPECIES: hypothetical protein [Bacillus subtilis group]ARC68691.1 hypothetical protein B34_01249 [Bacillus licheniformis]MEC0491458.1 hypothetical protein [Bacillus licheniformis]QEO07821.1 hypothetical protein FLQ07_20745 [Bacillus paralicheniformis]UIN45081.1 hypothetical protein LXN06_15210 [Bacillus licheniformis]
MKLRDLLSVEIKKRLNASAAKNEKLSRKEWEEIMGVQRDIYKKVNGRFRRATYFLANDMLLPIHMRD